MSRSPDRPAAAVGTAGGGAGASAPATDRAGDGFSLYQLLVDSVRDYAIFALDPTGHVMSWNAGAERLKGYRPEEIIGRHFRAFYPPDKLAEHFPEYELEVAGREGRFEDEGWRIRKDGTRFWAGVVITALRDETGTLVGFAKVTRDLTERRAAHEQALADARRVAEIEASSRAKTEFLTAMSHELRTPLNAIGGYAALIEAGVGGEPSEPHREYLARIRASQQHLLAIITDLLNYGRIEAGQVQYDLAAVPLPGAIDAVIALMESQATLKHVVLERGTCEEVAAWADRVKVEQILLNLVSNAIKFTPPHGRVRLSGGRVGEGVAISVEDTGPGIPPDQRTAVFEPFVQLGRTLASAHEGTGLGLAISRDLARALGGELAADAADDGGARFTLTLPAADDADDADDAGGGRRGAARG